MMSKEVSISERVDNAEKVLGITPYNFLSPEEWKAQEDVDFKTLAYTDWGDALIPTTVKWANGQVDSFTDLSRSIRNRNESIRMGGQSTSAEKRWVYGTRTNEWYIVGKEDRDWEQGITQEEMEKYGKEWAKEKYLSPHALGARANPTQKRRRIRTPSEVEDDCLEDFDCFKEEAEELFDPDKFDIWELSPDDFRITPIEDRGLQYGYRYGTVGREHDGTYTAIITIQGQDYYNEANARTLPEALKELKDMFWNML